MNRSIFFLLLLFPFGLFSQSEEQVNFNLTELGTLTFDEDLADIWGYNSGEKEYALVGRNSGFSIVDVTDPFNPVELHQVNGPNSLWRDIKTFGHYAYGVHEDEGQGNQGLIIIDLSGLPEDISVKFWNTDRTDGLFFQAAHNIFIDEQGVAYLIGHNAGNGGVIMVDIATDPENPKFLGAYEDFYVHDCFARGDTLWTAEVSAGDFALIDISDKSNPSTIARQETVRNFTHNVWLSDDGNTLFTTDERTGAPVASYDVSDPDDIQLLGEYRSAGNVIPHNAFVRGDNVIVSYYTHGIVILDAVLPEAMVEVGRFDTSPEFPGPGFHGAWGVYPYLPSGNILVSDIEEGLYILSPEYQLASRILGNVTNANGSELPIPGVVITSELNGRNQESTTALDGGFFSGFLSAGTVTLTFTKPGFITEDRNIDLSIGENKTIEVQMQQIEVNPTDTVFIEVFAGQANDFCSESVEDPDLSFICSSQFQSEFGDWDVNTSGCLEYSANEQLGVFVDTICFSAENSETSETSEQVVIISVVESPVNPVVESTSSSFLIRNPIRGNVLQIDAIPNHNANGIDIYSVTGQRVHNQHIQSGVSNYSIPLPALSPGNYFVRFINSGTVISTAKITVLK